MAKFKRVRAVFICVTICMLLQGCAGLAALFEAELGLAAAEGAGMRIALGALEGRSIASAMRFIIPEISSTQGVLYELRAVTASVARGQAPRLFLTRNGVTTLIGETEPGAISFINKYKVRLNVDLYSTRQEAVGLYRTSNELSIIKRIQQSGKLVIKLGEVPGGMYKVMVLEDGAIGFIPAEALFLIMAASGVPTDRKIITCYVRKGSGAEECPICHKAKSITCPTCRGERFSKCSACGGDGFKECRVCNGTGGPSCRGCLGNQRTMCTDCNNNGKLYCRTCGAVGSILCSNCFSVGFVKCNTCDGRKYMIQ